MSRSGMQDTELVVRTIAQTALDNEQYFCELDAVAGDGDFGYSLARGFEKLLEDWDNMDHSDPGAFLKKTGMTISSRIGGPPARSGAPPSSGPASPSPARRTLRKMT